MALTKLRDRFNRKQAERVFLLEAQRALLAPQGSSVWQMLAYVVAAIILLLPVMFFGFGLWIITANWFNIPASIIGLLFLGLSYLLFT